MPITLGIAGGTGAGKTTLARQLFEELGGDANVTYLVHDSYYKDLSHNPIEVRAQNNFDHPDSLETELLVQHVQALKRGEAVEVPTYDFATHSRVADQTVRMEPRRIILIEGILIMCETELVKEMDIKVFVEAEADIRLLRRMARDTKERGRTVEDVMHQYQTTVRPMHEQFVEPSKREADIIVHSTKHSFDVAKAMLISHLRLESGLVNANTAAEYNK